MAPLRAASLVALLCSVACRQIPDPPTQGPYYADPSALGAVAAHPDLDHVHRDLALLCPRQPLESHRTDGARCSVSTIGAGGALHALGVQDVLFVQRLDAEHLLAVTRALELRMLDADEGSRSIARGVLDPKVADDGRHAAWVELVDGSTVFEPGAATRVVLWDAIDDVRWVVSEESSDSSPVPVPDAREVLLVSRRSGVASYWLVGPEREPTQLTNAGLTGRGEGFVPVHAGQLVWLAGERRAVYSADYGQPELWVIDLDSGDARAVGPGRLPMLRRGGGVLAVVGEGASIEVVEYEEEALR